MTGVVVLLCVQMDDGTGRSKEEWKGDFETNKILGTGDGEGQATPIPVDSTCVRVGSLRCHSQAITVKLTRSDLDLEEIHAAIQGHNEWVNLVPNTKDATIEQLTPAAVSARTGGGGSGSGSGSSSSSSSSSSASSSSSSASSSSATPSSHTIPLI
jgi:aspartate-semialdehyde dehydrogenase